MIKYNGSEYTAKGFKSIKYNGDEFVKQKVSGETWVFNDEVDLSLPTVYDCIFISNGLSYSSIRITRQSRVQVLMFDETVVFDDLNGWSDEVYKTVTFETSPTGDLLTWLQANAVKQ